MGRGVEKGKKKGWNSKGRRDISTVWLRADGKWTFFSSCGGIELRDTVLSIHKSS